MKLKLLCIFVTAVVVITCMCSFINAKKDEAQSSTYSVVTLGRNMLDKDRIVRLDTPEKSYILFVAGNGGVVILK